MIAATDTVARDETALVSELDQELIILDVADGKYLTIDPVGAAIWRLIEHPVAVEALVEQLAERYDAPAEQIRQDVLAFLGKLADRGFVRAVAG